MDDIAVDLGIDPLEIRMRNAFHEGSASPTGQVLQSVVVTVRLLPEKFGWKAYGCRPVWLGGVRVNEA